MARELLTDWELASRLSYFLWSSMPDDGLFTAARDGALNGDGLAERSGPDVDGQPDQPLHRRLLAAVAATAPRGHVPAGQRNSTPPTTTGLRRACGPSRSSISARCSRRTCPSRRFLDSDWTMANARLCDFYGLPEPKTRRLPARLAQARRPSRRSAHDGRGARVDLGRNPPSPGASRRLGQRSDLQQDSAATSGQCRSDRARSAKGTKITIRQRIEAHAKNAKLRGLPSQHRSALGLAFDQYDAIGQWRTREQGSQRAWVKIHG